MKNVLVILILLRCIDSFSQEFPSDSIILKKIFGTTDKGGKTYTCKYTGEENIYSYQVNVVYNIVFKTKIFLNNKNLMLVIVEAPYGTQHGHQFGYQDLYFFKIVGSKAELVDSIKSDGVGPIGDASVFEIVDIAKDKKALISTFQSIGNQHYENTKYINLLELGKLSFLMEVNAEYNNSIWKTPESENVDCEAERYQESYEIIKNDRAWYDIKVHHIDYRFTKGCKDSYIYFEYDKIYSYLDGKYILKNN